jgi:hypothetical protein
VRETENNGRRGHRPKSNVESLVTGLVIGGGALAYWFLVPGEKPWWIIAVAVFAGLLPAARGLSGMITSRAAAPATKRLGERERAAASEKAIIRIASLHKGRLTPSLVVLEADISVEEAERILDGLARKGHASMRVRDDGRIEYEFAEFLPAPEDR